LPFIDDPCQLRAQAKVVIGACDVNVSLVRTQVLEHARL
jgi:hypothetical protein